MIGFRFRAHAFRRDIDAAGLRVRRWVATRPGISKQWVRGYGTVGVTGVFMARRSRRRLTQIEYEVIATRSAGALQG